MRSSTSASNLARVSFMVRCLGPEASAVMNGRLTSVCVADHETEEKWENYCEQWRWINLPVSWRAHQPAQKLKGLDKSRIIVERGRSIAFLLRYYEVVHLSLIHISEPT